MGRVDGKVAFISGAGHGQGRSHAMRLAQEGADVIVFDACEQISQHVGYPMSTEEDLAETKRLVEGLGRKCVARKADVRKFDQVKAVVEEGLEAFGNIDIVCASAGIISYHPHYEIPEDAWDAIVDVNPKGVWNTVRAASPSMIQAARGGSVVITSSSTGIQPIMETAHYSASKFGVVGLMKNLSIELGVHGIRVNSIHPCGVGADIYWGGVADSFMGTRDELMAAKFEKAVENNDTLFIACATNLLRDPAAPPGTYQPLPAVEPVDISNAVLFLASDEARYITGLQMTVDAGQTNKP